MAGEILYSSLSGNARVAAVLNQFVAIKLRDTASLVGHPSILQLRSPAGTGSSTIQVPVVSWGADSMSAVADGAAVANTAVTSAAVSITIARQALRRQVSDLAQLTNSGIPLDVTIENIAGDFVSAYHRRATSMLCALSSGISNSVGTTTVDLSVSTFLQALYSLQLTANEGPFVAVLHPQQVNDLMASMRSEAGPGQWIPANQELLNAHGPGLVGVCYGVQLYKSTLVPTATAGADYLGMMFAPGAFGIATASAAPIVGGTVIPTESPVMVEVERDSASGLTALTGSAFIGVGEIDDAKACGILSDA